MRHAAGPCPSLKAWFAAPPLRAWARPFTATGGATVLPLSLKPLTDIGQRLPRCTLRATLFFALAGWVQTCVGASPLLGETTVSASPWITSKGGQ